MISLSDAPTRTQGPYLGRFATLAFNCFGAPYARSPPRISRAGRKTANRPQTQTQTQWTESESRR
eukprot:8451858-Lingulodinium_polyedra.AAC.1